MMINRVNTMTPRRNDLVVKNKIAGTAIGLASTANSIFGEKSGINSISKKVGILGFVTVRGHINFQFYDIRPNMGPGIKSFY